MVSAMLMIPYFAYFFVSVFTGTRKKISLVVITIVILALQVFNGMGLIISNASMVEVMVEGIPRLELDYSIGPIAPYMFGIIFIMLALTMRMMTKAIKNGSKSSHRLKPVLFGFVVLFVGMMFNLLPVLGKYPIDLFFGLITSLIMFYAVYKTRVVELKFVITRAVVFTALLTLLVTASVAIVKQITLFFGSTFDGIRHSESNSDFNIDFNCHVSTTIQYC